MALLLAGLVLGDRADAQACVEAVVLTDGGCLAGAVDRDTPALLTWTSSGGAGPGWSLDLDAGYAAARLIVSSLDYDGDGVLSPAELGQDRLAFPPGTGSAAGQPGTIEALAEGAGLLRNLIERLATD